jgi:SAM-dependent methyltransferase
MAIDPNGPATAVPQYVHGHHDSVLRSHRSRTAQNSAAYLLPHLHPGQRLLDVGCGPGTITGDLAGLVAPGTVVATDLSQSVLDQARQHLTERQVLNVELRVADVYALDAADGTFDVVHAHQVLQHVPDPVGALRAMRRACAPGGLVAARDADYAAMTWFPQVPELDEWLALYRAAARATGGEPDAGRRLLSWAQEAGFTEVGASASVWCYATAESRQWWGGLWAERIVSSAIADVAVEHGLATPADLLRISAGWRTWAGAEDGWFTVLHGEVICSG